MLLGEYTQACAPRLHEEDAIAEGWSPARFGS